MSTDNLPDGWTRVKFGDIAASITERVDDPSAAGVDRYVGLEHLDPESTAIRRWGSPSDVEATKLRCYPGDVIYGRRRAYQRKLGVADFDGICSAHALVLRAKPEVCLPEFLPYFLQSDAFHQRALDISVGSLSPTINWKTLAVQEFALPPIEEQRGIASLIRAIDALQVVLGSALDRAEALHGAIVVASTVELEHKDWLQLGKVCDRVTDGPFGSKIKSEHYRPGGARVVRLQNIGRGEFLDNDAAHIGLDYYEELKSAYGFEEGDLVVAGLGDESNPLGRAAAVPKATLPAINKADCFLVRPGPSVMSEYLLLVLNSRTVLSSVAAQARGTTRSRVSSGSYKQVLVPVPDLEIQQEVVTRAAQMGQLRERLILDLKSLRHLRRAVLNAEVCRDVQ